MTFFLVAMSVAEIAFLIETVVLCFFASLIVASILAIVNLLTSNFLLDDLSALLAVLVTGMARV